MCRARYRYAVKAKIAAEEGHITPGAKPLEAGSPGMLSPGIRLAAVGVPAALALLVLGTSFFSTTAPTPASAEPAASVTAPAKTAAAKTVTTPAAVPSAKDAGKKPHAHPAAQRAVPKGLPKGFPKRLFGGPFTLTDHTGKTRTDKDFRGQFMLVYFGYTFCPDLCPTDLNTIGVALDQLPKAKANRIQPLFISVDPERDTQELLSQYVPHFHPRLIGMTGTEEQVAAVAKSYRVHRAKVIIDSKAPEDYLINHGSLTYLMDPEGNFVTIFPHDTKPEKISAALKKYVAQGSGS